eukprot:scaffold27860_cov27-Cyclotella_meneghiniana.AAC.3
MEEIKTDKKGSNTVIMIFHGRNMQFDLTPVWNHHKKGNDGGSKRSKNIDVHGRLIAHGT